MVFLIAALHALPIVVVAWNWNSKLALWLVAGASALVAVFFGNPAYAYADLLAIAVALWNCLEVVKRRRASLPATKAAGLGDETSSINTVRWVALAACVAILVYLYVDSESHVSRTLTTHSSPIRTAPLPSTSNELEPVSVPPPPEAMQVEPPPQPIRSRPQKTVEQCLAIVNEQRMLQCLSAAS